MLILTFNLYASTETLSYLGHLHKVLFMEVYMASIDFFIDRTSSPNQSDIVEDHYFRSTWNFMNGEATGLLAA